MTNLEYMEWIKGQTYYEHLLYLLKKGFDVEEYVEKGFKILKVNGFILKYNGEKFFSIAKI